MHLVLRSYAEALATSTLTEDEVNTPRAPPVDTTPPRV